MRRHWISPGRTCGRALRRRRFRAPRCLLPWRRRCSRTAVGWHHRREDSTRTCSTGLRKRRASVPPARPTARCWRGRSTCSAGGSSTTRSARCRGHWNGALLIWRRSCSCPSCRRSGDGAVPEALGGRGLGGADPPWVRGILDVRAQDLRGVRGGSLPAGLRTGETVGESPSWSQGPGWLTRCDSPVRWGVAEVILEALLDDGRRTSVELALEMVADPDVAVNDGPWNA